MLSKHSLKNFPFFPKFPKMENLGCSIFHFSIFKIFRKCLRLGNGHQLFNYFSEIHMNSKRQFLFRKPSTSCDTSGFFSFVWIHFLPFLAYKYKNSLRENINTSPTLLWRARNIYIIQEELSRLGRLLSEFFENFVTFKYFWA